MELQLSDPNNDILFMYSGQFMDRFQKLPTYFQQRFPYNQGRIQGGCPGGQDASPPFGGPPNFIKRGKTSHVCTRKRRILVLNSYPDPPPLSEILYPPLESHQANNQILWSDHATVKIST